MSGSKKLLCGFLILLLGGLSGLPEAFAQTRIRVTSSAFKNGGHISGKYVFSGFGCTGKNVSPEIRWGRLPVGTKSLAITVFDPDAPTGSGWWHWVVYNIPPAVHEIKEGAGTADGKNLPEGSLQGVTDFGSRGYGGPCPPRGDRPHHYIVTVYALKTPKLDVGAGASAAQIGYSIHFSEIGKGVLVGRYGR
jgi:Raf kinase inhibitor-like YbhB/YbcL family protein